MKMKTAAILSLTVLFGVAYATNDAVLDVDGDEIRTGVEYYVFSAIWGAGGGGLALGRTSRQKCPEVVVQRRGDVDYGIPVVFSNANSSDNVVRLSTDINIEFIPLRDRLCLTSTVWRLDDYDELRGKWWLTTDGVKGNPGPDTLSNWFKIEKSGDVGYKFSFCRWVCSSCKILCSDFGKYDDDGQIRLALVVDDHESWG